MNVADWLNRHVAPLITALGITPRSVTLEVRGRKSGNLVRLSLSPARLHGKRYLVSLAGERDWVKNVRAAHGDVFIFHGGRVPIHLSEVPAEQRAPILLAYVRERAFTRSAKRAARLYFGQQAPTIGDMERLAPNYPVFLMEERASHRQTPLAGGGQEKGKVYLIGALTESWGPTPGAVGLRDGLEALGYRENTDYFLGVRFTQGKLAALQAAARELVGQGVDVIHVTGFPSAKAVQEVTNRVPVVFTAVGDPVGLGLIDSLARPGRNITGVTDLDLELRAKRLELFRELIPRLRHVRYVYNPADTYSVAVARAYGKAARELGIEFVTKAVHSQEEGRRVLAAVTTNAVDGIIGPLSPASNIPGLIPDVASQRGIPTLFPGGGFWVERGALLSYGPDWHESGRQAARLLDKILRGPDPTDIPVETNPRVELIINLKTATALGLTIPPSVLVRADEVIQ